MEYYVVIDGQKQGPFDILSVIKKIKNGIITPQTLISSEDKMVFYPAIDFEEIKPLLKQEKLDIFNADKKINFPLKEVVMEGLDLWSKLIIEFTVISTIILVIGFVISNLLKSVQIIADYPSTINYVVSFVFVTLFSFFFYYVLVSRRSQEPDLKDLVVSIKKNMGKTALFAAIFSLYTLPFEISLIAGLISIGITTLLSCFLIFVPFLIHDNSLGLKDAIRVSVDRTTNIGMDNFGAIIALVCLNLAIAIFPALFLPNLFVFGLFISLPITAASFAYMYDQVFA